MMTEQTNNPAGVQAENMDTEQVTQPTIESLNASIQKLEANRDLLIAEKRAASKERDSAKETIAQLVASNDELSKAAKARITELEVSQIVKQLNPVDKAYGEYLQVTVAQLVALDDQLNVSFEGGVSRDELIGQLIAKHAAHLQGAQTRGAPATGGKGINTASTPTSGGDRSSQFGFGRTISK